MSFARPHRLFAIGALCVGVALFIGIGGISVLVRASESSIEFVGNLINSVHHISMDRLDPTCPRWF